MSSSEDDQSSEDEFSDGEDDVLQAIFDAEDEDEDGEFEGFPIRLPENMNWTRTEFEANIEDYSLLCGPKENAPRQESALGHFQLFWDNRLIEQITEFTNKNAVAKRAVDWKRTTSGEIKALLAMTIISNDLLVAPRDERRFDVCLTKQQQFMRMNRGVRKKDCPFKDKKSTFKCMKCNVYLCIGKEGSNCFYDYHSRLQYWL